MITPGHCSSCAPCEGCDEFPSGPSCDMCDPCNTSYRCAYCGNGFCRCDPISETEDGPMHKDCYAKCYERRA